MKQIKIIFVIFFLSCNSALSQVVDFGTLTNYIFFTSTGAVSNAGPSTITGDIGSNVGAITLPGAIHYGTVYNQEAASAQAKLDLCKLYKELICIPTTDSLHSAVFGSAGDTLKPGVYAIVGAGSLATTLYLNALGDSNAVFIMKFSEAFSTAPSSCVTLVNGAKARNVFWIAEGAASMGASTTMIGTVISHFGAVSMASSCTLTGRLFTLVGAISVGPTVAKRPNGYSNAVSTCRDVCGTPTTLFCNCAAPGVLPIDLVDFSGECLNNQIRLNWETASETNNDYFSIERSNNGINWSEIAKMNGAGNSSSSRKYFLDDENRYNEISYYQLKQYDFSGISRTFSPISVKNCVHGNETLSIFPNPAQNAINIHFDGEVEDVINTTIVDLFGRNIYQSSKYQSVINIENFKDGIYFLEITLISGNITRKFVVSK